MLSGGGVFTHVDQFINRMHNKYNITLFCNSSSDERDKFLKSKYLDKVELKIYRVKDKRFRRGLSFVLQLWKEDFSKFNIIQPHLTTYGMLLMHKFDFKNQIVIARTHGIDVHKYINNFFYQILAKAFYDKADQIFVISDKCVKILKQLKIDEKKIHIVPGGIDYKEFSSIKFNENNKKLFDIKTKFVLTFIGHMDKLKGADRILSNLDKLMKLDLTVLFVGNYGRDNGYVKSLIEFYSIKYPKKFKYLGMVNHDKVKQILSVTDFSILPSRFEGLGISIIEAMAAKKFCIGSNIGGIPYAMGGTGKLFNDSKEIINIVKNNLDKNVIEVEGKKSQLKAKEFDWGFIMNQYDALYSICYFCRF